MEAAKEETGEVKGTAGEMTAEGTGVAFGRGAETVIVTKESDEVVKIGDTLARVKTSKRFPTVSSMDTGQPAISRDNKQPGRCQSLNLGG